MSCVTGVRRGGQQYPARLWRAHLCTLLTLCAGWSCLKHGMACVGQEMKGVAAWPNLARLEKLASFWSLL
jgi:hypothetical protein